VGQRFHDRSVHSQYRVEEMSEPDAMRLRDEPEARPVTIEAPWPTQFDDIDSRFVVTVEQLVCDLSAGVLYVSSNASEPNHWTLTTVTSASGRMPRTAALGWRSSSLLMASTDAIVSSSHPPRAQQPGRSCSNNPEPQEPDE